MMNRSTVDLVQQQLVAIHQERDASDYRTRWKSREFRSANGWLFSQRAVERIRRDIGRGLGLS